jgi:hypothetical protein
MKLRAKLPLSRQISSDTTILSVAIVSGFSIFAAGILLQRLVYDNWLHRTGFRLVGSLLAGVLMFAFAYYWQSTIRERKIDMLRRFQTIARMNDRIRNALQVIECATYATNPQATTPVRNAVDKIKGVLEEIKKKADVAVGRRGCLPEQSRDIRADSVARLCEFGKIPETLVPIQG